jgi:type VI secretion system secreted protein Hcp
MRFFIGHVPKMTNFAKLKLGNLSRNLVLSHHPFITSKNLFMKKMLFLLVVCFLLVITKSFSQVFISFPDSQVPTESMLKGHEKETEIMSIASGYSNPAQTSTGKTGLSAGRVSITDISYTKLLDKSSFALMTAVCTGAHFPKTVISFYGNNSVTNTPYRYLVITLEEVMVSSMQQTASGAEKPTESVSLSFAKIKWEYFTATSTGVVLAGTSSWDRTKMQAY